MGSDQNEPASAIRQQRNSAQAADWKRITPARLLPAVEHIRDGFDKRSFWARYVAQKECFNALHPIAISSTEPAIFRDYFYQCIQILRELIRDSFSRLLKIALAHSATLSPGPIEWCELQIKNLIAAEARHVDEWIKSVCDQQKFDPTANAEEIIFWNQWRAPRWIHMQPNGNTPYDSSTAWVREDEEHTKRILKALREDRWVLSLEIALEDAIGKAHEALAAKGPVHEQVQASVPATSLKDMAAEGQEHKEQIQASVRSTQWRSLHTEFRKLVDEELAAFRSHPGDVWLRGYWHQTDGDSQFDVHGGSMGTEFLERFSALALEAGKVKGAPQHVDPVGFWLKSLYEAVYEHKAFSQHGRLFKFGDESGGFIQHVCEASAWYCKHLETESLRQEHKTAASRAAQPTYPPGGKLDAEPLSRKRTIIGSKIDKLRKECGWSYDDLANRTGLDKKLILGHVNKGKGLHPKTLKIYADAFTKALERNVSVNDLETTS